MYTTGVDVSVTAHYRGLKNTLQSSRFTLDYQEQMASVLKREVVSYS